VCRHRRNVQQQCQPRFLAQKFDICNVTGIYHIHTSFSNTVPYLLVQQIHAHVTQAHDIDGNELAHVKAKESVPCYQRSPSPHEMFVHTTPFQCFCHQPDSARPRLLLCPKCLTRIPQFQPMIALDPKMRESCTISCASPLDFAHCPAYQC